MTIPLWAWGVWFVGLVLIVYGATILYPFV
jgi:hypothetical protein